MVPNEINCIEPILESFESGVAELKNAGPGHVLVWDKETLSFSVATDGEVRLAEAIEMGFEVAMRYDDKLYRAYFQLCEQAWKEYDKLVTG